MDERDVTDDDADFLPSPSEQELEEGEVLDEVETSSKAKRNSVHV